MGRQRTRRWAVTAATIGVLGGLSSLAAPAVGQEASREPAGSWLGLASDNRAPAIIDSFDTLTIETQGVGPTIDGVPPDAQPSAIAFAPDGRTAYVADGRAGGGIVIIDTQSLAVSGYIGLDGIVNDLAVSADGSLIVAADPNRSVVVVIDTATETVLRDIPLDADDTVPGGVALSPDGSQVYVTRNYIGLEPGGVDGLDIFDPATGDPQHSLVIPGAGMPTVTPDGETVYLVSATAEEQAVIGIDPQTGVDRLRAPVEDAYAVYASPEGGPVVVASLAQEDDGEGGAMIIAHLSRLDATGIETNRVLQDIPTPSLAFTPDGARLLGPSYGSLSMIVIDGATFEQRTQVEHVTDVLAIAPDQAPTAVLAAPAATGLGSDTVLDASGSFSPTGSIVRWDWDFGDGTTASTTEPVVHHRYEHPGAHAVSVTVTNSAGTSTQVVHTGKQVLRNGGPSAVATATAEVRGLAATGVDPSATVLLVGALLALGAALGAASVRRSAPRNRA